MFLTGSGRSCEWVLTLKPCSLRGLPAAVMQRETIHPRLSGALQHSFHNMPGPLNSRLCRQNSSQTREQMSPSVPADCPGLPTPAPVNGLNRVSPDWTTTRTPADYAFPRLLGLAQPVEPANITPQGCRGRATQSRIPRFVPRERDLPTSILAGPQLSVIADSFLRVSVFSRLH